MKIEVNISKKYFIIILSSIIILAGMFAVYAFNQNGVGGNPAVAGHSVDEIDWSKAISGNISAQGFCAGGGCITNMSQLSSSGTTVRMLSPSTVFHITDSTTVFSYTSPVSNSQFIFGRFDTMSGRPDIAYAVIFQARWTGSDGTVIKDWEKVYQSQSGLYSGTFNIPMFGASKIEFRASQYPAWDQYITIWGYSY